MYLGGDEKVNESRFYGVGFFLWLRLPVSHTPLRGQGPEQRLGAGVHAGLPVRQMLCHSWLCVGYGHLLLGDCSYHVTVATTGLYRGAAVLEVPHLF